MVQDTPLAGLKPAEFYVVSIKKLAFMYGVTMGLYLFAWFYQHWKCYQRSTGTEVLPVFRAFFNGFYVFRCSAGFSRHWMCQVARTSGSRQGGPFCYASPGHCPLSA